MTDKVKNIKMPDGTILQIDPDLDNKTITKNTNDELQSIGIINSANNTTVLKTWTGTKAEYDNITEKDNTTIYNITDDENIEALIDLSDYLTVDTEQSVTGNKLFTSGSLRMKQDDTTYVQIGTTSTDNIKDSLNDQEFFGYYLVGSEYQNTFLPANTRIMYYNNENSSTEVAPVASQYDIKENWTVGVTYLIQNTSLPITGDDNLPGLTFDLSTIIPKDGKNYEVIISGLVYTTDVSHCAINIDTGNMWCGLLTAQTTGVGNGTCTAIVNNDRKIKIYNYGDKAVTLQQLTLCAYKPIK